MGGTSFSRDDYDARTRVRAATSTPVFAHTAAINSGKIQAGVHPDLSPLGVKIRESRDSAEHPETVPVIVHLDTTGSMQSVPEVIQSKLPQLMGAFLEAKASGKAYLGEGYPAIMISANDDSFFGEGVLQTGQFESGMEIDQMLEKLWLTGSGSGERHQHECYQLGLYFAARHTAHDHMDKRGRKGYMFIIGDEYAYDTVQKAHVKKFIGDTIEGDIPLADIVREAQEKYHVFYILPNQTTYYNDTKLHKFWRDILGADKFLRLEEPENICNLIVGAVAICEQNAGLSDLVADGLVSANDMALVPLSKSTGGGLSKYSADNLPAIGSKKSAKRL